MFFYISVQKGEKITGKEIFILGRVDGAVKYCIDFVYIYKVVRDGKSINLYAPSL